MTYAILIKGTQVDRKIDAAPEFATFEDACAFVHAKFANLAYFEIDQDVEGAADFITTDGGIYAIEAI